MNNGFFQLFKDWLHYNENSKEYMGPEITSYSVVQYPLYVCNILQVGLQFDVLVVECYRDKVII